MTALILDCDVDANPADSGFGSVPGFAISVCNPAPPNIYTNYHRGQIGDYSGGAGIMAGVTDMTRRFYNASGVSQEGFFDPVGFDGGSAVLDSDGTVGFSWMQAQPGQAIGSLDPICYGAQYDPTGSWPGTPPSGTTVGGPARVAHLMLGNRCQKYAGSFDLRTTPGNQSVNVGFRPDLVIFVGCFNPTHGSFHARDNTNFMIGATDGTSQWVAYIKSVNGSGWSAVGGLYDQIVRYGQFHSDACIGHIGTGAFIGAGTVDQLASIVSMDTTGFTINLSAAGADGDGTPMNVAFLAVKADPGYGSYKVGVGTQGSTTTIAPGFAPDAMLFASSQLASSGGAVDPKAYISLGVTDGILQRNAWQGGETGPLHPGGYGATPISYGYYSDVSAIRFANQAQVLLAEASVALTGTGADLTWSTDDGGARLFGWIALQNDTDASRPSAFTDPVLVESASTAILPGHLIPYVSHTVSWYFQYGLTTSYGSVTPTVLDGSGSTPANVSAAVAGLTPFTLYHYRLVVIDNGCPTYGPDLTFMTGPLPRGIFHQVPSWKVVAS